MILEKYIDQLKQLELKVMDSGCFYNTSKWHKLSAECKSLINDYADKYVSRAFVIKTFEDYYSGKGDYLRAFLLTMIWGFEDTGYGTHRTNNYISKPENSSLIKAGIDAVKNRDLKLAFFSLKKIKGLGISYISKILYFATKGAGYREYALIFDIRVATSLIQLTTTKQIFEIVKISPSSKFDDYHKYNKLIHRLAHQHDIEPDAIELFLYRQDFSE